METSRQRLSPLSDEELARSDDDTRTRVELLGNLNIFRTLAHHPDLLRRWLVFANHVLTKTTLPERARELIILRVGWRCGSDYEFGQHTIIGSAAGVTADEIRRITTASTEGWAASDATLLTAADELVDHHELSDATWAALGRAWSTQQVMDLVFTVGEYVLVCMALRSFGVQREDDTPGFPA